MIGCSRRYWVTIILLLCFLAGPIQANEIEGYWVWAGISPGAIPSSAALYVYQGIITQRGEKPYFVHKGLYPFPLKAGELYLSFRLEGDLPDAASLFDLVLVSIKDWQRHGVKVTGVQLDFDSPTAKLLEYSDFLTRCRSALPHEYKLSITGLGDWVLTGNPAVLRAMADSTDEIIFQLYQGRKPLPDIDIYVDRLAGLAIPFKVGLLAQYPYQQYIARLDKNRYFSGVILFVQR